LRKCLQNSFSLVKPCRMLGEAVGENWLMT